MSPDCRKCPYADTSQASHDAYCVCGKNGGLIFNPSAFFACPPERANTITPQSKMTQWTKPDL